MCNKLWELLEASNIWTSANNKYQHNRGKKLQNDKIFAHHLKLPE
jgi:hypothetical protein